MELSIDILDVIAEDGVPYSKVRDVIKAIGEEHSDIEVDMMIIDEILTQTLASNPDSETLKLFINKDLLNKLEKLLNIYYDKN